MKTEVVASLQVLRPGDMTPKGRREIALWLRRQAADLVKHGKDYSTARFRARYWVRKG